MHAQEQHSPPRGAAAIMAIAIQSGLVYLLAVGLGVAPPVSTIVPGELLPPVKKESVVKLTPPQEIDPSDLFKKFRPQVDEPPITVEKKIEPVPTTTDTGPKVGSGPVIAESPISPARVLVSHDPVYPHGSIRSQEEGTTYVRIQIGPDGKIAAAQIERSSGFSRLDEAALKAVRTWRFAPATRGGQGVAAWVVVPVVFELR